MESDHSNIRSVEISLGIIQQLVERDGARVTELAEELDIAPSTAHNHLRTLLNNGFVIDEGSVYYPSLEFLHVGEYARQRKVGYQKAEQHVKALAEESGGRTHFTVLEHGHGRYVYTKTGDLAVETFSRYGSQFPLHVTAAGKAMLAELPDWQIQEIVDQCGLKALTDQSITDEEELFAELEATRERGVAFNFEEHNKGISAVAASVQEPNGSLLGALTISGPAQRFKGDLIREEFPDLLLARVNELELDIVYSD
ncbi:IclR family transcriptional regulator (plasmid) [Natrinema zhouii]|uniref:IclR family transcriptional regulator n=1 Tax=Natrinema zhouii TaxID=1710539 RepID=UPI001CFF9090|nr:IclR family transcriptional regulator [Natrinema zhouii]UHQ98861.1 IclR family transcriptional regulator [Natrinema zhouii]